MVKPLPRRIAKAIAESGHCSRRDAERLILEGRVKVEGKVIKSPALNVTDEVITIDDMGIEDKQAAKLYAYYKPIGLITTHKDEKGRATVFSSLPKKLGRLISVGRLDLNSEGLLLLTNDGELSRKFELPKNKFERVYRVRVFGRVPINELKDLKNGITIEGVRYDSIEVEIEKLATNSWLKITLTEGKNREIRRVLKYLGLEVNRLIRIQYGKYKLNDMKPGEIKEVKLDASYFR